MDTNTGKSDVLFDCCELANVFHHATVADILKANKLPKKVKDNSFVKIPKLADLYFLKNCDSLHARLNSHYKACSYKKKKHKKIKHTGNLFRKNLKLKDIC